MWLASLFLGIKKVNVGDKQGKRRYEKLTLLFKVGRITPTGLFQIIFDDVTQEVRLHFPNVDC